MKKINEKEILRMRKIIIFVMITITVTLSIGHCVYAIGFRFNKDAIPPQILEWYNSDVVSKKRPNTFNLGNKHIWDLSKVPKVDLVDLSYLNINQLTSLQIKKLQDWIRTGIDVFANDVWGSYNQCSILQTIFKVKIEKLYAPTNDFHLNEGHIVNVGVEEKEIKFRSYQYVIRNLSYKESIIIKSSRGEPLMGMFYYGKGRVYFNLLNYSGATNYSISRLQLNFLQWIIGEDVPILTLEDIEKGWVLARIKFKDGKIELGKVSEPASDHINFQTQKLYKMLPWTNIQWIEVKDEFFKEKIPREKIYGFVAPVASYSGEEREEEESLGMRVSSLTPEIREKYNIKEDERGVIVIGVKSGGPADEVGIAIGAVIMEVNHKIIEDIDDFKQALEGIKPGDTVLLRIRQEKWEMFKSIDYK